MPMTDFIDAVQRAEFHCQHDDQSIYCGPDRGTAAALRARRGGGRSLPPLQLQFEQRHQHHHREPRPIIDTTSGAWEFPILAKYRFKGKIVHPFVSAGVAWDKLSGLTQTVTSVVNNVTNTTTTSNPFELAQRHDARLRPGRGRGRESAGDPHLAGSAFHALGREALHRPDRLVQQQAESGGVFGRNYVLDGRVACPPAARKARIRWIDGSPSWPPAISAGLMFPGQQTLPSAGHQEVGGRVPLPF